MKRHLTLLSVLLHVSLVSMAGAVPYYYDNNGATAGFGTAGNTWGTAQWSTDGTGGTLPAGFTTGLGDSLNFGNGATGLATGAITVSGTQDSGDMTIASGSGTITLNSGTINLASTSVITVNGGSGVINSGISGAATSVTKTGANDLTFGSANSYTGLTILNQGLLRINNAASLGSTTTGTQVNSGGRLHMNTPGTTYNAEPLTLNGGSLWVQNSVSGVTTWTGAITMTAASALKVDNGGTMVVDVASGNAIDNGGFLLTIAGRNIADTADDFDPNFAINDPIIGAGGLTFQAGTVLTLAGTNTYSGDTTVSRNILRATNSSGLPNASFLILNSTDAARPSIFETGNNFSRTTDTVSGAGKVNLANSSGLSAFGGAVNVSLNGGATLNWGSTAGFNPSTLVLQSAFADSALDWQNNINLNATTRSVQVLSALTAPATISGAISNSTGTAGLTKSGAGLLILSNTNSYNGTTSVTGGVLRANEGTSLPTTGNLTLNGGVLEGGVNLARTGGSGAGQMQITGGTSGFSANGGPVQVAFGSLGTPTALTWGTAPFQPGTLVLNASAANNTIELKNAISLNGGARTVQVDSNTATLSGSLSGGGSLTKTGAGKLAVTAASTMTAGITHSNGMLVLSGANTGTMGNLNVYNFGNHANGWLEIASGGNYKFAAMNVSNGSAGSNQTVFHQSGGTLETTGNVTIGSSSSFGQAYVYKSDGTMNVGGTLIMGVGGGAGGGSIGYPTFFTMSGGALNVAGNFSMQHTGGGGSVQTKRFVMSGGTTTVTGTMNLLPQTTNNNTCDFVLSGGTATVNDITSGINLGTIGNSGNGRVFLGSGALLEANKIIKNTTNTASNINTVYFNGGTLRALSNNATDFMGAFGTPNNTNTALGSSGIGNAAFIYAGGATFDTNGKDVTVNPALLERTGGVTNSSLASVTGITALNAGSNYSIAPDVSFTGGGGTGAVGYATLDSNGGIAAIVIADPGTGYTSAPTVTLSGGQLWTAPGSTSAAATPGSWTVNLVSASAGGLTKTGAGALTLARGTSSYTGATNVNAGVLSIDTLANGGTNSSIGKASNVASNLVLNGGTLSYTGGAISTDRLFSVGTSNGTLDASGSGAVNFTNTGSMGFNSQAGARLLTLTGSNTGSNAIAAVIGNNSGSTSLTKSGLGSWTLSGNNTYSGNTTVSQGTLSLLNPVNNNIANSPLISLATGGVLNTTGLGAGPLTGADLILASGQTLKGTGTVVGNLTVAAGSRIAPGNSPGMLNQTGNQTWNPLGMMQVEINDATGASGGDPGWDLLSITGLLNLNALNSLNQFEVELVSLTLGNAGGLAANFSPTTSYAWRIVDSSNVITTYTGTDQFTVDTSGFVNPFTGTFTVRRGDDPLVTALTSGNSSELYLYYADVASVPEPSTLVLSGVAGLGLALVVWRRKKCLRSSTSRSA